MLFKTPLTSYYYYYEFNKQKLNILMMTFKTTIFVLFFRLPLATVINANHWRNWEIKNVCFPVTSNFIFVVYRINFFLIESSKINKVHNKKLNEIFRLDLFYNFWYLWLYFYFSCAVILDSRIFLFLKSTRIFFLLSTTIRFKKTPLKVDQNYIFYVRNSLLYIVRWFVLCTFQVKKFNQFQ